MTPAGEIVDSTLRALRRVGSDQDTLHVYRILNKHYFSLCSEFSFIDWRRELSIDFTDAADDTGLWLPANLFGIDRVRDGEADFEFYPRDRADIEPDEPGYRYNRYVPDDGPLVFGEDAVVSSGTQAFTSTSLGAADHTDEYIKFGREPGFYKLTAALTFTPKYYGPDLSEVEYRIRPEGTQKMVIYDPDEQVLDDRTVTVYYWIAPTALYHESDPIVLPHSRALELLVMREAMQVIGKGQLKANTYTSEIDEARAELLRLNPSFPRSGRARDVNNNIFEMKNVPFQRRS